MPHGYIHGLYHPVRGDLRYIGQTTTSLAHRLASHVCPSSLKLHTAVTRWSKSLVDRGLKPIMQELLGTSHHGYRHDLSTQHILERLSAGASKAQVARELGVAPTFVHRRLKAHKRDFVHQGM